jgi:hypothetical protein
MDLGFNPKHQYELGITQCTAHPSICIDLALTKMVWYVQYTGFNSKTAVCIWDKKYRVSYFSSFSEYI